MKIKIVSVTAGVKCRGHKLGSEFATSTYFEGVSKCYFFKTRFFGSLIRIAFSH